MASPVLSLSSNSPSFNTYSSDRLAEIAARVVEELRLESGSCEDDDIYETGWPQQNRQLQQQVIKEEEEEGEDLDQDDDFEFAFVCKEAEASPISADEIFYNGQIRPIYPLFDTSLLLDENQNSRDIESGLSKPRAHRPQLRKLMSEERETMTTTRTTTSCSSSEADEVEGAAPGTYCVWTPKKGSDSDHHERCKKSNSTGNSSKRWNLRQLLYRSNSDGKDTFVFLAPSKRDKSSKVGMEIPGSFKFKEADCGNRNRDLKAAGEKTRSYLPYRQDLVGIVSNVKIL